MGHRVDYPGYNADRKRKFEAQVDQSRECWLWTGRTHNGYGSFRATYPDGTSETYAHRWAWYMEHGVRPPLFVCHRCDTPLCVRAKHLFEGDNAANMADMARKLRAGQARLDPEQVRAIRTKYQSGQSQTALAAEFGVAQTTISGVIRRESWRHIA